MVVRKVGRKGLGETDIAEDRVWIRGRAGNEILAEGVASEVLVDAVGEIIFHVFDEDICDDAFVDVTARGGEGVSEAPICLGTAPVVDSGSVAMNGDQFGGSHHFVEIREFVVVAIGVDEGGAGSEKGNALGPDVLQRFNAEEMFRAHECFVSIGAVVKGDKHVAELLLEVVPHNFRQNEKKRNVGEE